MLKTSTDSKNNQSSIDPKHRHSLQPKTETELPPNNFRHTQSYRQNTTAKKSDKTIMTLTSIPDIPENFEEPITSRKNSKSNNEIEPPQRKTSKKIRKSDMSNSAYAFQNNGFEGNLDRKSISSRVGSDISRAPSLQSLEVIHEQYCCCAKRTRCERRLLITVTVLGIIIIVLVIVIALIASKHDIAEDVRKKLNL